MLCVFAALCEWEEDWWGPGQHHAVSVWPFRDHQGTHLSPSFPHSHSFIHGGNLSEVLNQNIVISPAVTENVIYHVVSLQTHSQTWSKLPCRAKNAVFSGTIIILFTDARNTSYVVHCNNRFAVVCCMFYTFQATEVTECCLQYCFPGLSQTICLLRWTMVINKCQSLFSAYANDYFITWLVLEIQLLKIIITMYVFVCSWLDAEKLCDR